MKSARYRSRSSAERSRARTRGLSNGGRRIAAKGLIPALVVAGLALLGAVCLIAIFGNPDRNHGSVIAELRDLNPLVRARAAFQLSQDRRPSAAAIWALARVIEDREDEPRSEAVAALISIGRLNDADADAVIRAMTSVLSRPSSSSSVRVQATHVLSQLGMRSRAARDPLLAALQGADHSLRAAAASALGQIGVGDDATLEALDQAIADSIPEVRAAALDALTRLRPADGTPSVAARLLADTSVAVRLTAVYALAGADQYETKIDRAIDVALRDSMPEIRRAAAMVLSRLAPNATSTRDKLQRLSADPVASVRQAALEALSTTGSSRP